MHQLFMRRSNLEDLPTTAALAPGYTIRAYRETDAEPLSGVFQRAFPESAEEKTPDWVRKTLANAPDVLTTFVVDYEGVPVSTASLRSLPDLYPESAYVHWVATDPAFQGKGLGSAVTIAVLQEAARRGMKDAVLETDDNRLPAIRTYQHLGFLPEHRHETHLSRWSIIADMLAAANF